MIVGILFNFLWYFLFATLGAYIPDWFIYKNNPPKHKLNLIIGIIIAALFTIFDYCSK